MGRDIKNIHDKFFNNVLSDIYIAKKFIASFLSPEVLQHIDMETLQYAETDFLLQDLKEIFSDIVFAVNKKDEQEVYISIILEHKSRPDDFTAVQLLLYVAYGYYKQYKNTGSLQLILPIVFYHGKQKWIYKSLQDLLNELPPELKLFIPAFKTVFIDLKNFSDEQLDALGDALLTSILLLEKYAFRPDELAKKIRLIYEKLNSVNDRNLLYPIIVYSMSLIKINIIKQIIKELPSPIKSNVMTAYDTLIQEGMEKGIQEGMEKGIQKGIQKGREEGMQKGLEKGREEGLEEGLEKGLEKSVLNLHKNDFPIPQIAHIMELSVDKVKGILKKNNCM